MCLHHPIAIRLNKMMTNYLTMDTATTAAPQALLGSAVVNDVPMHVQQLLMLLPLPRILMQLLRKLLQLNMQLCKLSLHHPSHLKQLYKLTVLHHIKNRRLYKLDVLHINTISPSLILDIMLDKQAIAIIFLPSITTMICRTWCVLILTTRD